MRLLLTICAVLAAAAAPAAEPAARPPNVVVILADDKEYNPGCVSEKPAENLGNFVVSHCSRRVSNPWEFTAIQGN